MRQKGKIASWNADKGYGFITPLAGGKQIFMHVTALGNRNRSPKLNDVVTYSTGNDAQGRPCATDATLAGDKLVKKARKGTSKPAIFFALLFLAAVAVAAANGNIADFLMIGYMALSVVTFGAYAIDKLAARRGSSRTSEGTLLLFGLVGGWPGALIAQQLLRHKSKKFSFRAKFWITVLMNCAALAWLHTNSGKAAVQGIFA